MISLEEARHRLARRYRQGLGSRIEALSTLAKDLDRGDEEADSSIRRIAHQLRGSGTSFGIEAVTTAAAVVEEATREEILEALGHLLAILQDSHADSAPAARILVIDDHESLADLISHALVSDNRAVTVAGSIASARDALDADLAVIILDLMLPDGDGRDLLVEITTSPILAQVPIIVLTAHETESTQAECLALGATHCLVKPVRLDLLVTTVEAVIGQNRRSRADATVDTLTGLPNRAGFAEAFARAEAQSRRGGRPLSVALLDLDHFKAVNDRLGHAEGDRVLVSVSTLLQTRLRRSDVAARWGGEEFVVLFPDTDEEGALTALEDVRGVLRRGEGVVDGRSLPAITVSGGVVCVDPGDSLDAVVARADRLLYLAKANGRDLVLDNPAPRSRIRVLVVEDEPDVADAVRLLMGESGYEVEVAHSLAAARSALTAQRHQVVVLDRDLPDGSGLAFISELRGMPGGGDRAIVMLTAAGSDADVEAAFANGASDYVHKPFKPRRLLARIQRLLPR